MNGLGTEISQYCDTGRLAYSDSQKTLRTNKGGKTVNTTELTRVQILEPLINRIAFANSPLPGISILTILHCYRSSDL
ncbi:hypothetical protein ACTXT7_006283 [Hymenolepis weldensis]